MCTRFSILLTLMVLLLVNWGCNQKTVDTGSAASKDLELTASEEVKAREIITTVCEACHHPGARPDERLAPPLEIVKRNYLAVTSSKGEFVEKVTDFILYPNKEEAQLHSEVEEFGLMDPIGYSEEEIRNIAIYIYENTLEKPDWVN